MLLKKLFDIRHICVVIIVLIYLIFITSAQSDIPKKYKSVKERSFVFGQYGFNHHQCPSCDQSVYSYCSYKLEHDHCCCGAQFGPSGISLECRYADCQFIYAKTCYEHDLIKNCCCERPFFQKSNIN